MISNGFQDIPLLTLGVTASTGEASGSTDDKQDYNEQDDDYSYLYYSKTRWISNLGIPTPMTFLRDRRPKTKPKLFSLLKKCWLIVLMINV